MRPIESTWQIVVVPTGASRIEEAGWRVPAEAVRPLVNRLRGAKWSGAEEALALGRDFIPGGERVQTYPPNCTLQECGENNQECNDYCAYVLNLATTCAFCDRRRTGETCSTTCYCVGPGQSCGPNPYL